MGKREAHKELVKKAVEAANKKRKGEKTSP